MDKYISKGIELYFKGLTNTSEVATSSNSEVINAYNLYETSKDSWFEAGDVTTLGRWIPNLYEIGDLTSGLSAEREQIEVTTLKDDKHVYVDGILADSEFDSIDFKFYFTPEMYEDFLKVIETEKVLSPLGAYSEFKVRIPNKGDSKATVFTIVGVSTIKLDGVGVNGSLNVTVTITPKEEVKTEFNVA